MNTLVQIYLAFDQTSIEFNKFMNSISDVIEHYGYANSDDNEEDTMVKSLIVVKHNETENIAELIRDSVMIIIPTESKNDTTSS